MTPWRDLFETQQLTTKISGATDALRTASVDDLDAPVLEKYSRLLKALGFIKGRLKSVDPELVSQTSLTNLGSWTTNIASYMMHAWLCFPKTNGTN
jgi:hypothetical protein